MKIKNKHIVIILVSVAIVFSVFGYIVKGASPNYIQGNLVFMDSPVPQPDGMGFEYSTKEFENNFYLPSDDCDCKATVCSFVFPDSVKYPEADVTKDGRIDFLEVFLYQKAYGSNSENNCYNCLNWTQPFPYYKCLFVSGDLRFEDPTRDCYINQTDIDLVASYYGTKNTNAFAVECTGACAADVDKNNYVDITDIALIASKYEKYADTYKSFSYLTPKDLDIYTSGDIDISDIVMMASSFGAKAIKQVCKSIPAEYVGGKEWRIKASGYGIYHAGASFSCIV